MTDANTIRDALIEWGTHRNEYRRREDCLAALDRLEAQLADQRRQETLDYKSAYVAADARVRELERLLES